MFAESPVSVELVERPKTVVTPAQADEWIKSYDYGKAHMESVMRPISQAHVSFLAREMLRGRFQDHATIEIAECAENDRRYIVNGNHTLRAIVLVGIPQRVTVEFVRCATMGQVRARYATYDTNRARNRKDSLRAYHAMDVLGLVSQDDVARLATAVGWINGGMSESNKIANTRSVSPSDLLQDMRPWTTAYGQLTNIVTVKAWRSRIFNRRAVLAVALITTRYHPAMATKFWQSVVTGEGLTRNAPALKLRDFLLETGVKGGGAADGGFTANKISKFAAYCWNRHFEGKSIDRLSIRYDKPIEILGTPPIVAKTSPTLDELRAG